MDLYPAVDVQGGRVARADIGDPLAVAAAFARAGARWLHFVDLDRAFGRGDNRSLARAVLAGAGVPVQVGGGLRSEEAVAEMLAWGATRVVLGTQAATDPALVSRLLARHGAARLAIGIDARDGRIAPRGRGGGEGGTAVSDEPALALAERVRAQGARTVIYTDVARDGTLAGPDIAGARTIAALGLDVVVSGGVASLEDLRQVRAAGLSGAIVGRALHEGRFTLAEALACVV
jgi:phosphoribosylformimino-5-aminoimidazole carboxamide ribotide isomerase